MAHEEPKDTDVALRISPRRVRDSMLVFAVWLTVCTVAQNAYYELRDEQFRGAFLFDVRVAGTPVDWYSALALFFCAVLMAVIASAARSRGLPHRLGWTFLAALFVFLSLDEGADIHDRLSYALSARFDTGGIFEVSWIIPAAIVLPFLGAAYIPLVRDLPRRVRGWVIAAGTTFLTGAFVLEIVEGLIREAKLRDGPGWSGFGPFGFEALENLLEMIGIALLAYALLLFLERLRPPVRLGFGE